MFELFNVVITNIAKWFKSGKSNKHRRFGFCLTLLSSVLWVVYFVGHEQYYLASNSIITIALASRGIKNNG